MRVSEDEKMTNREVSSMVGVEISTSTGAQLVILHILRNSGSLCCLLDLWIAHGQVEDGRFSQGETGGVSARRAGLLSRSPRFVWCTQDLNAMQLDKHYPREISLLESRGGLF
jgi:hypothetical protein